MHGRRDLAISGNCKRGLVELQRKSAGGQDL